MQVFLIRGGRLIAREHFVLEGQGEESEEEIVWAFVVQYYSQTSDIPDEVVLPDEPNERIGWKVLNERSCNIALANLSAEYASQSLFFQTNM